MGCQWLDSQASGVGAEKNVNETKCLCEKVLMRDGDGWADGGRTLENATAREHPPPRLTYRMSSLFQGHRAILVALQVARHSCHRARKT